jgi:protoheme IX farnesyltransferase
LFKAYYRLTKPGIIYGNLMTALAGFLLASKWHIRIVLLVATLLGIALVIASACVFNNYIDRGIDSNMARTKKRALVVGSISAPKALIFGSILGAFGFLLLGLKTNALVVVIGVIAFVIYIAVYGFSKRHSVHSTLIGSIAGAAPIVAGYCAVTDRFNGAAIILFLILASWQMPHFYAIAMYRSKDYKAAGLPVLPVYKNMVAAKRQIIAYILVFIVSSSLLYFYGYSGYIYLIVSLALGLSWLYRGLSAYHTKDEVLWARQMFFFSLIVITGLSAMVAVSSILP